MNDEAGRRIGKGIAWLGFWLMVGLVNFGQGFEIMPKVNALIEMIDKTTDMKK